MKTIITVALAAALTVFAYQGSALANDFNVIGSGCVPDDNTVSNDKYNTGGHGVFVKGTGTARFICPIAFPTGSWSYFRLYYNDTEPARGNVVTARLRSAAFGSTVSTTHVQCTSNTATTPGNVLCDFSNFSPASARWYWIEVLVSRANTTHNPEFLGVALW